MLVCKFGIVGIWRLLLFCSFVFIYRNIFWYIFIITYCFDFAYIIFQCGLIFQCGPQIHWIIKVRKLIRIVKTTDLTFLDFAFLLRHPGHVWHTLNGRRMQFRTCRWDDNVVRILFSETISRTASHCTDLCQVRLYVPYLNNVYRSICTLAIPSQSLVQWASYQICKIAGCICAGNYETFSPAADFKGNR